VSHRRAGRNQQIDPELETVKELRKVNKSLRDVVRELEAIAGLLINGADPAKIREISAAVAAQKQETQEALERNTPPDTPAGS